MRALAFATSFIKAVQRPNEAPPVGSRAALAGRSVSLNETGGAISLPTPSQSGSRVRSLSNAPTAGHARVEHEGQFPSQVRPGSSRARSQVPRLERASGFVDGGVALITRTGVAANSLRTHRDSPAPPQGL